MKLKENHNSLIGVDKSTQSLNPTEYFLLELIKENICTNSKSGFIASLENLEIKKYWFNVMEISEFFNPALRVSNDIIIICFYIENCLKTNAKFYLCNIFIL